MSASSGEAEDICPGLSLTGFDPPETSARGICRHVQNGAPDCDSLGLHRVFGGEAGPRLRVGILCRLVEQYPGLPQVGRIGAFGELAVDWRKQIARLLPFLTFGPMLGKASGGAQFQ